MAKSDIIASLKLNSTDYEQKLAKAKESTRKFSKDGGQGLTDMVGKFKGIAVAVAGSKAAMEVFNRVVASSQTLTDTYARTMDAARTSADQFFYSIGSGDFTAFNNGLDGIIRKSKEASRALDDLGTYDIVLGYFREKYASGFRTSIASAKDKQVTPEERAAAKAAAEGYFESYKTAIAGKESELREALSAVVSAAGSNIDSVSLEKIEEILEQAVIFGKSGKYAEAYNAYKRLPDLQKSYDNAVANALSAKGKTTWGDQARATKAEMERLRAILDEVGEEEAKIYNVLLERFSDKKLSENLGLASSLRAGQRELAEWQTAMNELNNQLNQPIKPGTVGEVIAPKHKVGNLSLYGGNTSASELPSRISGYAPTAYFAEGSYEAYIAAQGAAREYADALAVLDNTSLSASEGLGALSGAMGNLSGMLGEGAGAWMNYAGGIVSAVGSALPSLEALAAAQAAAAVTKTALSPWTVVSGIAAVTSIIAAMAQLPKFVTGGVVPGNALSGDNVLIRANSGETVLTKQQANNIGSLLQGIGGTVKFKIEGGDLVGVLNNHNSITSRSYGH